MMNILVVDDEEGVASGIAQALRRESYGVWLAHSGVDALKLVRRDRPDLIILDIIMPGMDGLEVCLRLRQDPLFREIPILFLTTANRLEDRLAGLEAGGDDYLAKPFDLRELRLRVKAILRRVSPAYAEAPQTQLKLGSLSLDCRRYSVTVNNEKTVLLTPVEFDLLYHLMSHPGEVFSGQRLLQDLWNYSSDTSSPDLVRMHIRNLRLKLEEDSRNPRLIITVPRHGYTIAQQ